MASTELEEQIASNRLEWPRRDSEKKSSRIASNGLEWPRRDSEKKRSRIASNGQPASTAASKLLSDSPANLAERLGSVQKT